MKFVVTAAMIFTVFQLRAQGNSVKLYDPAANAEKAISDAVKRAKAEGKNVLIQAGGNWCAWCIEFNRFCHANPQVDSLLKADFITCHLNYSNENKNASIMAKYGYPQRFGFPVFIVLDGSGNRIHIQNSAYLEQGKTYHIGKVIEFLRQWNRSALNPGSYKAY